MSKDNKKVLKLNADYNLIDIITIRRALSLYVSGKIRILIENEDLPIVHPFLKIRPPMIVVLKEYKKVPYKKVKVCRKNILLRDNYICQYCGCHIGKHSLATVDHIIPKCKNIGNNNTWENLVACCVKCNNKKGDKTMHEIGMKLLRNPFHPKIEDIIVGDKKLREIYRKTIGIEKET
jgi:5-methylcytosine-specific restriction endonuclease McrA